MFVDVITYKEAIKACKTVAEWTNSNNFSIYINMILKLLIILSITYRIKTNKDAIESIIIVFYLLKINFIKESIEIILINYELN